MQKTRNQLLCKATPKRPVGNQKSRTPKSPPAASLGVLRLVPSCCAPSPPPSQWMRAEDERRGAACGRRLGTLPLEPSAQGRAAWRLKDVLFQHVSFVRRG